MRVELVAGAMLVVLGAGGLAGVALSAETPARVGAAGADHDSADRPDHRANHAEKPWHKAAKHADKGHDKAHDKAAKHASQRAFVAAKQEWTRCVGEAARAREPESGRFDPDEVCGVKPHPHDARDGDGRHRGGRDH